jgi:hypothetical protein
VIKKIELDSWVYVLVKNPGEKEQIVGQEDAEKDVSFIPAFTGKDAASHGVVHMVKEKGHKYEIQAILFEDLLGYAEKEKFLIFVIDEEGAVMEKYSPDGTPL